LQIKELEAEKMEGKPAVMGANKPKNKIDPHKNDDLMNFLEHKLEDVENKLKR